MPRQHGALYRRVQNAKPWASVTALGVSASASPLCRLSGEKMNQSRTLSLPSAPSAANRLSLSSYTLRGATKEASDGTARPAGE